MKKETYSNAIVGQPLISAISTGCKTPFLEIKYCNLIKPFFYPNSPTVPRYSLTCIACPIEHKDFLHALQNIEKIEKVESILKNDNEKKGGKIVHTGKILVKFQSKENIPVYVFKEDNSEPILLDLQDELTKGEKVIVEYDILRYTKKNTVNIEHGISFKPSCVYLKRE